MRRIFFFLWMLTFLHLNSQHLQLKDETLNVSSLEVANLMRFSDFPDLNYIGKVNISIPLYTINYGGMEIPLSIEYNTKGNKVSDVATVVGLGWNLSAGGSVTQRVHDTDDFIDSYNYYSDDTYEPEQAYASADYAITNGGRTLEMTWVGRGLEYATEKTSYNTMKPFWDYASYSFGRGTQGTANVFINQARYRSGSIWNTVERPLLQSRGININAHLIK